MNHDKCCCECIAHSAIDFVGNLHCNLFNCNTVEATKSYCVDHYYFVSYEQYQEWMVGMEKSTERSEEAMQ